MRTSSTFAILALAVSMVSPTIGAPVEASVHAPHSHAEHIQESHSLPLSYRPGGVPGSAWHPRIGFAVREDMQLEFQQPSPERMERQGGVSRNARPTTNIHRGPGPKQWQPMKREEELNRRVNWKGVEHDVPDAWHAGAKVVHDIKRDDELSRRVNWKGLEHDVPDAWHAGAKVVHDFKRDEELTRRVNWKGLEHDVPDVWHAGAKVAHDFA